MHGHLRLVLVSGFGLVLKRIVAKTTMRFRSRDMQRKYVIDISRCSKGDGVQISLWHVSFIAHIVEAPSIFQAIPSDSKRFQVECCWGLHTDQDVTLPAFHPAGGATGPVGEPISHPAAVPPGGLGFTQGGQAFGCLHWSSAGKGHRLGVPCVVVTTSRQGTGESLGQGLSGGVFDCQTGTSWAGVGSELRPGNPASAHHFIVPVCCNGCM